MDLYFSPATRAFRAPSVQLRITEATCAATADRGGPMRRLPVATALAYNLACALACALPFALLPGAASAERPRAEEARRWIPSIAITTGLLVDGAKGEVESTLRPSGAGTESIISPWFGASVELMSPAIEVLGKQARFFAHGGVAGNFGTNRDVAKEGSPGPFVVPALPRLTDDALVRGQGSTTSLRPNSPQSSVGAGMSIDVDTPWRRIRVKPSVEYLFEKLEVTGTVRRAISNGSPVPDFVVISGSDGKHFHGIGPGLEVETQISRAGPFDIALTVAGSAYKILGDRDVEVTGTDPTATGSATWRYRRSSWAYRGYVGLRFMWAPDAKRRR